MTKNERIKQIIHLFTIKHTKNKKTALAVLIKEGMHDMNGNITKLYGGKHE